MKKIGFLINPIAGMGGAVGLKGTDGEKILKKAIQLGAKPITPRRANEALKVLKDCKSKMKLYISSGKMGGALLKKFDFEYEVVYHPPKKTTGEDTKRLCEKFLEKNVDLVLFCGGDGTARDIYEIIDKKIPMIGIPSGVKMHSGVFGLSPKVTGEIVADFIHDLSTTD